MSQADPLALLSRALDQAAALIAGTRAEQAALPTPCRSWTVSDLVGHLVKDVRNFASAARGEKPDYSKPIADVDGDAPAAFDRARRDLDEAWGSADPTSMVPGMGGEVPLISRADHQIAELAVHSWDLARATGQSEDLDVEVAEHGLRWARQNLDAQFRGAEADGKAFGEEVPVAEDAPAYQRLAGWFGRDPGWSSPA